MTDDELVQRLLYPPVGLDWTIIMFDAAERIKHLAATRLPAAPPPPVAWRIIAEDTLFLYGATITDDREMAARWEKAGNRIEPLYAAPSPSPGAERTLEQYKNDWRRNVIEAFGHNIHTNQLDRFIELAELNGLFDPAIAALRAEATEPAGDHPHVRAAFINAIAEEGTKAEAVEYLQKTWNENCELRKQLVSMQGTLGQARIFLTNMRNRLPRSAPAYPAIEAVIQKIDSALSDE